MRALALLLDFDGTVYQGDLLVHAYARHVAERLDPAPATAVIDGMREFLEGKHSDRSQRLAADLSGAEDGVQAVEILAATAGLNDTEIRLAHHTARADLTRSAFAVDAAEGLLGLLTELRGTAWVSVVTDAEAAGVDAVLDSIGLAPLVDEVITGARKPADMPEIVARSLDRVPGPDPVARLLAIGDRWGSDLAAAHQAGARTALIDRFGRGYGDPTWRGPDLRSMIPDIRQWSETQLGGRATSGAGR